MKVLNQNRLPKYQRQEALRAIDNAVDFLNQQYILPAGYFDQAVIKFSTTCRFSKFCIGTNHIRIDANRNYICLYDRKSLYKKYGKYKRRYNNVGYETAHTCSIIHELTHYIQGKQKRCFSEVETTENELVYLIKKGTDITYRDPADMSFSELLNEIKTYAF
jgi:hypothetical protein